MSKLKPSTAIEQLSGNAITESAFTLVSVFSGAPVAALLPLLGKSLASERQRRRVEEALLDISADLEAQKEKVRELSDSQFKFVNESVLAVLHTTSEQKLAYLRQAIRSGMQMSDLQPEEAVVLSRVVRDISAQEADFLVKNFRYNRIQVGEATGSDESGTLVVPIGGREELIVNGLTALGLVVAAGPTMDDQGLARFSSIVAKVIVLLRDPSV